MTRFEKTIGLCLIVAALGIFVPYTVLTIIFDYPDILRAEGGTVLTKFHEGGTPLVYTWLAFALLGAPLIPAYSLIGLNLEQRHPYMRWVTAVGLFSCFVQMIGLLRWVFVIPVLANSYMQATDDASRNAIVIMFQAFHQFGGVLLGEHLGQLGTIIWTCVVIYVLYSERLIPRSLAWFGYLASGIYLFAQSELLATVIPGFPVVEIAGFIGSTCWLVWLISTGVHFLRKSSFNRQLVAA